MDRRHRRPVAHRGRLRGRRRLLVVVVAPLVVLLPLASWAAGSSTGAARSTTAPARSSAPAVAMALGPLSWSRSWDPPLALLSDYAKGTRSRAGFLALPLSMATDGSQEAVAKARFRTRWVDVKALVDGPNVVQQGLSVERYQFKLQIMHGPLPSDHRANCHISGSTGHVLAFGPRIDVADGQWHTVTCVKSPDTARGTKVVVTVDGVAGKPRWSRSPIGLVDPRGDVRLGGRTSRASSDSLDGWISSASFRRS